MVIKEDKHRFVVIIEKRSASNLASKLITDYVKNK